MGPLAGSTAATPKRSRSRRSSSVTTSAIATTGSAGAACRVSERKVLRTNSVFGR